MFKGLVLLITGGTGSFGNAVLRRFLDLDIIKLNYLEVKNRRELFFFSDLFQIHITFDNFSERQLKK